MVVAGRTYGRLRVTATRPAAGSAGGRVAICMCSCGRAVELDESVIDGGRQSCGCDTAVPDAPHMPVGELAPRRRPHKVTPSECGQYVRITAIYITESQKAVKVSAKGKDGWVPRTQMDGYCCGVLTVKRWFAAKKGWL